MTRMRTIRLRELLSVVNDRRFGEAIGVTLLTVFRWRNGINTPNHASLCKVADFFLLDVEMIEIEGTLSIDDVR